MTITLDLPDDLERVLIAEAARLGVPVSEYAARLLVESKASNGQPGSPRGRTSSPTGNARESSAVGLLPLVIAARNFRLRNSTESF